MILHIIIVYISLIITIMIGAAAEKLNTRRGYYVMMISNMLYALADVY